jgi:hypothetical protein
MLTLKKIFTIKVNFILSQHTNLIFPAVPILWKNPHSTNELPWHIETMLDFVYQNICIQLTQYSRIYNSDLRQTYCMYLLPNKINISRSDVSEPWKQLTPLEKANTPQPLSYTKESVYSVVFKNLLPHISGSKNPLVVSSVTVVTIYSVYCTSESAPTKL